MSNAYVYTLNLKGGNKYVGYTQEPSKRISDHFNGNGAQWTPKHQPVSVNSIQKVSSVVVAKSLETKSLENSNRLIITSLVAIFSPTNKIKIQH
jgi:predicted GIY-YIG superfamily endonuclease